MLLAVEQRPENTSSASNVLKHTHSSRPMYQNKSDPPPPMGEWENSTRCRMSLGRELPSGGVSSGVTRQGVTLTQFQSRVHCQSTPPHPPHAQEAYVNCSPRVSTLCSISYPMYPPPHMYPLPHMR